MKKGEKYTKAGTITQTDEDGNIIHTEDGIVIGRGENKRVVTEEQVRSLALLHCTLQEIADIVGVRPDTLSNHFSATVAKAKSEAKSQLRKAQWKLALSGNATMQIWLGKNILGQTDQPNTGDKNDPLPWED